MPSANPHATKPGTALTSRIMRAALASLLASGVPLAAASVVAVLSSDADPYRKSLAELTKGVTGGGHLLRPVMLEQLAAKDLSEADCVVAIGTAAAAAVHGRSELTAPLVYCMVTDSTGSGLDAAAPASGIEAKVPIVTQLQLVAEALPQARRIGMLHSGDEAGAALAATVRAALPAGWELKTVAANQEHLGEQIAAVTTDVDVVWTSPDGSLYTEATVRALLLNALRRRVPVFGFSPSFVRAGALLGVGIDPAAQGGQAAQLAQDALARRAAGSAPQATRLPPSFQIAVNLVVADKLGVQLPDALVARATHVFQAGR